ncbi:hypothetical protein BDY19DRAFT_916659 [Irpex rosettiformis]|uniref:Uncharacterized protein n=1 Tax=Irpex rosettiformis TaxID=378272 RepID=A0ACB8UL44_9APHY|nr:hypothetical protein BDY19DRAFT_916659 [Irpex rosettiformis]
MRRTQSVRNHVKSSSMAAGNDELGVLREAEEDVEETLRRQLLEKDRENDKLHDQILQLKAQLAERPSLEVVQGLRKEYTNLELLLQGTQRENERCMAELERTKVREKALESQLEKLAGPNWQDNLEIASPVTLGIRSSIKSPARGQLTPPPTNASVKASPQADRESTKAYIEQVRTLVLGMEQRMQSREENLMKVLEAAELEGAKFEDGRRQVAAS